MIKFIYSEKATKFCEISPLLLSVCTVDKSKGEILQNFVAFSEYTNFIRLYKYWAKKNRVQWQLFFFSHNRLYVTCSTLRNIFILKYLVSSYFLWTHEALLHQGGKKDIFGLNSALCKITQEKNKAKNVNLFCLFVKGTLITRK